MNNKKEYLNSIVESICKEYCLPKISIKKSNSLNFGARYFPNKLIEYTEYESAFLTLWDILHELGHHRYQHKEFTVDNEYEAEKFAYDYIKENLPKYTNVYVEMVIFLSEGIDITNIHRQALKKLIKEI